MPPVWKDVTAKSVQFDNRTKAYISPVRILWKQVKGDAVLTGEKYLLNSGNGQAELVQRNLCHLNNGKSGEVSLLLDFGRELQGGLQIVTGESGSRDAKVHIRFGESASEAMSTVGEDGETNDHAIRDLTLALPWLGVAEYGNTGFRFVRIDLEGENADLLIKEIRACFIYRDIPYKGSCDCVSERLD